MLKTNDPSSHAEMEAIRVASKKLEAGIMTASGLYKN